MTTITLFMKSGNRIKLHGIKEVEVKTEGNLVTQLRIERHKLARILRLERVMVTSIDLSQIEAITVS